MTSMRLLGVCPGYEGMSGFFRVCPGYARYEDMSGLCGYVRGVRVCPGHEVVPGVRG